MNDLVMIHGWGINRCIWRPVIAALADTVRIHNLDLPGYASGDPVPAQYDLPNLADFILGRAPNDAVWLAWSMGAMVALQAAIQAPGSMSRLILVAATPRFCNSDDWVLGTSEEIFARFTREFEKDYARGLQRFLLLQAGDSRGARAAIRGISDHIAECGAPSAGVLRAGLTLLATADLRADLSRVTVPVSLVHGINDRVTPVAASEYLDAHLPDARLERVASGHIPFLDDPRKFVDQSVLRRSCS